MTERATPTTPATPETRRQRERRIFKAAIIDATELVEGQARDIGDRKMTESREDRSQGLIKKIGTRLWKHNLFQEYYRQKEIGKARTQIKETGNLYAGEEGGGAARTKEAMSAVIDRFTSEYDMEMLKDEERASKMVGNPEANAQVRDLIRRYAVDPNMGPDAFREERTRVLSAIHPDYVNESKTYADNLFEIAKEVRNAVEHGERIEEMDFDVQLTLGKAKESLNTASQENTFDRVTKKLQSTRIGSLLIGAPGVAAAGAALYSLGKFGGLSMLRSSFAKVATFGGTAFLAGVVAGGKESARLNRERGQHMRERAKGMTFEEDAKRREEMEANRYETRPARGYIDALESSLAGLTSGNVESADVQSTMQTLAELEGRIRLGDRQQADFIEYSRFDQVEQERTKLALLRAKVKVALRDNPEAQRLSGGNVNEYLLQLSDSEAADIQHNEVFTKDRIFKKMKTGKVIKTALTTMAAGAVFGVVGQEIGAEVTNYALGGGHAQGFISGLLKSFGRKPGIPTQGLEKHATVLEGLRRYFSGDSPRVPFGKGHDFAIGDSHIKLPEGVDMHANPDGTYDITRYGDVVAHHEHIAFGKDGNFTPETKLALGKEGIFGDLTQVAGAAEQHHAVSPADYIKETAGVHNPRIHRELWYDNDTPKFDQNELKTWLGGVHNTGIDKEGNYVFDMHRMLPGGSFHGDQSIDAPAAMKSPGLKMLFSMSRDTQHQPFVLDIRPDGTLVIPKDSEVAKLMFDTVNGHAVFKGQFAEVAQDMGKSADGAENFRILGTDVGHGLKSLDRVVPVPGPIMRLDVPDSGDFDMPYVFPFWPRTPLEQMQTPPKREAPNAEYIPSLPSYYYGGTEEGLVKEMELRNILPDPYVMKSVEGKKFLVDKDGKKIERNVTREQERIRSYLDQQDKSYLDELKAFEAQVGPMSEKARVAVIIPARFEEKNLENLLDQYTKQVDEKGQPIDPELFEINIIVNRKEGEDADKSVDVINAWKTAHPESRVNVIDVVFSPEKANVGTARKYITDLVLARSLNRASTAGPLYIESEDADLVSVDRRTVATLIRKFDEKPELDVLRGIQDRQPEILQKNALLFFERRAWDMMEVLMRRQAYRPENLKGSSFTWNRVISGGWNTAYTAEVYAQIGGYVPDLIGEDMKIGQKISIIRGQKDQEGRTVLNTQTAAASGLRANSSPRRFLDSMNKKRNVYDDFEDQSLKHKSIDELLEGVKEFAVPTPEQKKVYEDALNNLKEFIGQQLVDDKAKEVFASTLFRLGLRKDIDFKFRSDGRINLTDQAIPRVIELLGKYRDEKRYLWGYKRQNTPLDTSSATYLTSRVT